MKLVRQGISLLIAFCLAFGGVATVLAADAGTQPVDQLIGKVKKVTDHLFEDERETISQARTTLRGIGDADKKLVVQPLIDFLKGIDDYQNLVSDTAKFENDLTNLVFDLLTLPYDENEIRGKLADEPFKDTMRTLARLGDADATPGYADLVAFVEAVENHAFGNVDTYLDMLDSNKSFVDLGISMARRAVAQVVNQSDDEVSAVLKGLAAKAAAPGQSGGDRMAEVIGDVMNEFYNLVDRETANGIIKSFVYAYIRSEASLESTTGRNGILKPSLKVKDKTIYNSLLTWEVIEGTGVAFENGQFKLTGTGSATVKVQAREIFRNGIIYRGTITLQHASQGGGAIAPAIAVPESVTEVKEKLNELNEQLAQLPESELRQQVRDVEKEVAKAIKELAVVPVTVSVDDDGVARTVLNAYTIVNLAKEAKQTVDELNGLLESVGGRTAAFELTIDLGEVSADRTEIELDADLVARLADAGVDRIAISVGGAEIVVAPAALPEGGIVKLVKKPATGEEALKDRRVASDVYDVEIVKDGTVIRSFAEPVELRLPVANAGQFNTDLLTLAKIDGDQLIYFVGIYDQASGTVNGLRDSLSSYVVVENRVTFNDLAPVERWAGPYIAAAASKGIIVGDGKGAFRPQDNVTRAEFVKMLVTALSLSDAKATEPFLDVEADHWYYPYVSVAVSKGIIAQDRLFNPNRSITREEMAAMIGRVLVNQLGYSRVANADETLSAFSDNGLVYAGLKQDVALAAAEGVMIGSGGKLNPKGNATRAEAAVVIKKLLDLR